jgi:hypothetical protein
MKSIKSLVSKAVSAKFLEQGPNQFLEIQKSPHPGGLTGKLSNHGRGGMNLPPTCPTGPAWVDGRRDAKRGHCLIELFKKSI